jgi:hypothetical protein
MRREGMAQHMRMHAFRIEAGPRRQGFQLEREMLPRQVSGAPMGGKMRSSAASRALQP